MALFSLVAHCTYVVHAKNSLRHAWESTDAFHRHYRTVKRSDVPFAQSALGDQYFIRDNDVYRLDTECDEIESLELDLRTFLDEVQRDPIAALNLEPLEEFWDHGDAWIARTTDLFSLFGSFPAWENLLFRENKLSFRVLGTFPTRENGRKHESHPPVYARSAAIR